MILLERLLFVIVFTVTAPLLVVVFGFIGITGVFIGLPIAGIKYALTGSSGIDWYFGKMSWVQDNWPLFIWNDSLRRRSLP